MIPFILFLTVIILVIFLGYLDVRKKQNFMRKLGYVDSHYLPVLGNLLNFVFRGYSHLYVWLSSEEPSGLLWILSVPIFYTRRPEELQTILLNKNSLAKSMVYRFGEPLKHSLVATSVESWRPHRRLLNKCFRQKQIFEFIPQYGDYAKVGMDQLLPKISAEELSEIFMANILDAFFVLMRVLGSSQQDNMNTQRFKYQRIIVCTLGGFGINNFHSMMNMKVSKIMQFSERILVKRLVSPWLYINSVFWRTEDGKQFKETMKEICDSDTRAEHTTGSALAAALLLLGMHKNVQEKVYQEVMDVVGEDDPIESEHLSKLKYTLMVIYEALRLFPPLQCVARQATGDIDLGGGRFIPNGTEIIISITDIHRDKKLWTDPHKFIPERFLPEEVEKRHPCCFIPFSYGPRNCIAYKFAETVMKIYVANIVRKYQISTNCKDVSEITVPKGLMFLFPDDIEVEFEKR